MQNVSEVPDRVVGLALLIAIAFTFAVVSVVTTRRARQAPDPRDSLVVRQTRWLGRFAWLPTIGFVVVLVFGAVMIWTGGG